MSSRHRAFGVLTALLGAVAMAATPAFAQTTTTTPAPTVTETQSFTVTIPPPKAASPAPSAGTGNAGAGSAAAAPLPGQLAYTGADPWLIIAGGTLIAGLSLLARRRARS